MRKCMLISSFVLVAITLWSLPVASQSAPTIDPRVLEDTSNGKVGDFLVTLKSQTNTRAVAGRALNRAEQGRAVFEALRDSARFTQPAVLAILDRLGAKHSSFYVANVIAVKGDRKAVDAMAARSDVSAIESDRGFHVNLETPLPFGAEAAATVEWNIAKVNAPDVWAQGYTGQGRVYANADTGVQWDHPSLKPQYRGWDGTTANHNFNWWDAVHCPGGGCSGNPCGYDLTIPCDDYTPSHGTHTMGTGIGNDGLGNTIGMAPGARWIACRNMDQGNGTPSRYLECMQFFLAPWDLNGNNPDPSKAPDAVGNSYTCPVSEGCSDAHVLQLAMQNVRNAGVFMAASAGNSGSGCGTINETPAIEDSAITIGATDSSDAIASFSSRGPVTIDGSNLRKPDLVAPGVSVRSSLRGNTYGVLSGTSMSSPHVAGAVVLLWSAFQNIRGHVDVTEQILEDSAVPLFAGGPFCGLDNSSTRPNNVYGYGRLDVLAAYNYLLHNPFVFRYIFPLIFR